MLISVVINKFDYIDKEMNTIYDTIMRMCYRITLRIATSKTYIIGILHEGVIQSIVSHEDGQTW